MSAAMAQASDAASPKKGGKKLLLIVAAAVVLLLIAAGAAVYVLKARAAAADAEADSDEETVAVEKAPAKKTPSGAPPTFLALDSFTVNLADKTSERYAQVGITLEVDTAENAEKLKAYMPAIRNNVLMILAHKTSEELLTRSGKERLAREIMRESVRPMGIEIEPEEDEAAETQEAPKPRKKKRRNVYNPVQQVHFSNFIVQ